mmetsp:Transcript_103696/g.302649  ORF Transcript_103696/g.302649 Transcript_103696/m.302649 type:complete len:531 (-) Transcript_103696:435-2027(-)
MQYTKTSPMPAPGPPQKRAHPRRPHYSKAASTMPLPLALPKCRPSRARKRALGVRPRPNQGASTARAAACHEAMPGHWPGCGTAAAQGHAPHAMEAWEKCGPAVWPRGAAQRCGPAVSPRGVAPRRGPTVRPGSVALGSSCCEAAVALPCQPGHVPRQGVGMGCALVAPLQRGRSSALLSPAAAQGVYGPQGSGRGVSWNGCLGERPAQPPHSVRAALVFSSPGGWNPPGFLSACKIVISCSSCGPCANGQASARVQRACAKYSHSMGTFFSSGTGCGVSELCANWHFSPFWQRPWEKNLQGTFLVGGSPGGMDDARARAKSARCEKGQDAPLAQRPCAWNLQGTEARLPPRDDEYSPAAMVRWRSCNSCSSVWPKNFRTFEGSCCCCWCCCCEASPKMLWTCSACIEARSTSPDWRSLRILEAGSSATSSASSSLSSSRFAGTRRRLVGIMVPMAGGLCQPRALVMAVGVTTMGEPSSAVTSAAATSLWSVGLKTLNCTRWPSSRAQGLPSATMRSSRETYTCCPARMR